VLSAARRPALAAGQHERREPTADARLDGDEMAAMRSDARRHILEPSLSAESLGGIEEGDAGRG
jgi:hypothetical protein